MRKAIIVAMSRNRVIGRNNKLPWYLPEDLRYFKQVTLGKPVIMGRATFESIGRPLPGRLNIVVSRQPDLALPVGVRLAASLAQAYSIAAAQAEIDGVDEIMLIGGGQLYAAALADADRLYITQVHADIEGDAWFPALPLDQWQEVARRDFAADEKNPYPYSLVVYDR